MEKNAEVDLRIKTYVTPVTNEDTGKYFETL